MRTTEAAGVDLWGEGGREGEGEEERERGKYRLYLFSPIMQGAWLTSSDSQVDEVVSIPIPLSVHLEGIDLEIKNCNLILILIHAYSNEGLRSKVG